MTKNRYSKVLIIDDSQMDNMLIRMILDTIHFSDEIISCQNPLDAIKILDDLDENGGKYPEIIFLDINMPIMSGFELLNAIQNKNHNGFKACRVYMLSSSDEVEDIKKASQYPNVIKYLQKPLNRNEIL